MSKRLPFVFTLVFLLLASTAFASGFTTDYPAIDKAAQSVLLLEMYDENDVLIATGSAFCAFDSHTLVTNYHVIEGASSILAYTDRGDAFYIDYILAFQKARDLALLKFYGPDDVLPLPIADTSSLLRAQPVLAIGSPEGYQNTISTGNISALRTDEGYREIQFTAPISSGSSGGALFNDDGEVIGITYALLKDAQNLNYAIDIAYASALYQAAANQEARHLFYFSQGNLPNTPLLVVYESDVLPLIAPDWRFMRCNSEGVQLAWHPVSGADCYRVYRSDSENGIYLQIGVVWGDTEYLDSSAPENSYYRLRAVRGNQLSDFSKTLFMPQR